MANENGYGNGNGKNGCDDFLNFPLTGDAKQDINLLREKARLRVSLIHARQTSQEVAGKVIGRQALYFITVIIIVGVVASIYLDEQKLAAVIGLVSAALTALISMANGIVNKDKLPEVEVEPQLPIEPEPPVTVNVSKGKVDIQTKDSRVITDKEVDEQGQTLSGENK